MSDKQQATSDKTSDSLLPCPFCGGEAVYYRTPVKTNGSWCDSVVVKCKECEARTGRILYDARKHPNDEEYDEAAALWNTRKPVDEVLDRLEEELNFVDTEMKRCAQENPLQFDSAKGCAEGLYVAIMKIKEMLT